MVVAAALAISPYAFLRAFVNKPNLSLLIDVLNQLFIQCTAVKNNKYDSSDADQR